MVEAGGGPPCHLSHPHLPAVAVPCPSLGVLGLVHTHLPPALQMPKSRCLQVHPPVEVPQPGGDGAFSCPRWVSPSWLPARFSPGFVEL